MENQILRTVSEAAEHLPPPGAGALIALGGDMRFAAGQLVPEWEQRRLGRVPLDVLRDFTEKILGFTVDELIQKYHLSFPEAETLGPALLAYTRLAEAFQLEEVLVTRFNLRNALLREMASQAAWSEDFRQQIVRSAIDLGNRFAFDEPHARHVAHLASLLFRSLAEEHQLDPRYEVLLQVAALLHEIGLFISNRSSHKHTMYRISNSELFGLGKIDKLIVAQAARYHRRASPQPSHEGFALLTREHRVTVAKLAAMLRVAKALDESRSQRIQELRPAIDSNQLVISIPNVDDLTLEQLALRQGGSLFEETFGLQVLLRPVR